MCQKVEERDITTYNEVPEPLLSLPRPAPVYVCSFIYSACPFPLVARCSCCNELPPCQYLQPGPTTPLCPHLSRSLSPSPALHSLPPTKYSASFILFCMRVQVADELVKEFKLDPTITFDEKNIRRRIYDALNVLMAMDIITRDKKNIRCCMHHSARARAL